MLIIIGVICLLTFAYFCRVDGYLGRMEQLSNYKTLVAQKKEFVHIRLKL